MLGKHRLSQQSVDLKMSASACALLPLVAEKYPCALRKFRSRRKTDPIIVTVSLDGSRYM